MKKRIRALKAVIMVGIMLLQLIGMEPIQALAAYVSITVDTTIDTETDDLISSEVGYDSSATLTVTKNGNITNQIYGSGGELIIKNSGKINEISHSNAPIYNYKGASINLAQTTPRSIYNEGTIEKISNVMGSGETITNSGTITEITEDSHDIVNTGYIGSISSYTGTLTSSGTIGSFKDEKTEVDGASSTKLVVKGGMIDSVQAAGGLVIDAAGSGSIGTLTGSAQMTGTGTLTVTGNLSLVGDYTDISPDIVVEDGTQIEIAAGSQIKVQYNRHPYILKENMTGTLASMAGNELSVDVADRDAVDMEGSTEFENKKYLYGQTAAAEYVAADGYYFPSTYRAVTTGKGQISTVRKTAKTVQIRYTFADNAMEEVNVSIPAPVRKDTQAAPEGLTGGVLKVTGVTSAMEYAASADSSKWTAVSSAGTKAMEQGTWYFRYKETDEKFAGAAAAVKVLGAGRATVSAASIYYGDRPEPVYSSDTNGSSKAKVAYKVKGESDSTYTETVPVKPGKYTVKVSFAANDDYGEAVAEADFTISYLTAPKNAYTLSGTEGANGYYISGVKLTPASGYLVADRLDGSYKNSLTITEKSNLSKIYLKKRATGEKTGGIAFEKVKIDSVRPAIDVKNGNIYYGASKNVKIEDANLDKVYVNGEEQKHDGTSVTLKLDPSAKSYEIQAVDKAGNEKKVVIQILEAWRQSGLIPSGQAVELYKDTTYTLGSGSWSVSGDATTYSGGQTFYVGSDGTYTFSNK